MSADTIISVENLGKRYLLRHQQARANLREALAAKATAPFRWAVRQFFSGPTTSSPVSNIAEDFWALQDISFDIKRGEVVGIIGRNGAGKSTLLKILSRITDPTHGRVTLDGRVASLLEVGTGFHPELSGRENIFLNGAILGMGRVEIRRKFDEIVAFAEVEKFLDTPVKHYSSGMYVRLAFAVAAHLDPEILIVDEVLAVGDAAFQKKCLGRLAEVARGEERTVLFVSHNMAAVQQLCARCILLDGGRIVAVGDSRDICQEYFRRVGQNAAAPANSQGADCDMQVRIVDDSGRSAQYWGYGKPLRIEVVLNPKRPLWKPAIDVVFYGDEGQRLMALFSDRFVECPSPCNQHAIVRFEIQNPGFLIREISIDVGLREGSANYIVLLRDAGKILTDYASLPSAASRDTLLHPETACTWSASETLAPESGRLPL